MNIKKILNYGFLLILSGILSYAQPQISIQPNTVKFEDVFNRIDSVYLINSGTSALYVDSISFNESFYFINFENNLQTPLFIPPNDSIKMTISLQGFYYVTVLDTADTVFIYNNSFENPVPLRVKIDFFDDDYGTVSGTVTDGTSLLDSTNIYFFYNGVYLCGSAITNSSGNYQIELPEGSYTVAAEKSGYRMEYYDNTYDPFFARFANVNGDDSLIIDFNLQKILNYNNSVSGIAYDSVGGSIIEKGVVVVRKGTHSPTLLKSNAPNADSSIYAGFIKPDGSYNIFVEDTTYYFVQGFSGYYLPTYYNTQNAASVFWQSADSIKINQNISEKNLYLKPDSSYGGGGAYGNIILPPSDALGYDGITILAKSTTTDQLYSYNFGKNDGLFSLYNIPYGTYQLIAQRIGSENFLSEVFTINPNNIQQYGLNIFFTTTDVQDNEIILPNEIKLYNNYPNPFNPATIISYSIPHNFFVTLKVYDILGNEIVTLVNEEKSAGTYEVTFNANGLASGVYITTIQVNAIRLSQKIILMK